MRFSSHDTKAQWATIGFPANAVYSAQEAFSRPMHPEFDPYHLPADFSATMTYVFSRMNSGDVEVIRLAYGADGNEPMPINEIADKFQVSSERIRTRIQNFQRHLRSQETWEMCVYGIANYTVIRRRNVQEAIDLAVNQALQRQLNGLTRTYEETGDARQAVFLNRLKNTLLKDMELPSKEAQLLDFAGLTNLYLILKAGPKHVRWIHEMGEKRYSNILAAISHEGIDISAWETDGGIHLLDD